MSVSFCIIHWNCKIKCAHWDFPPSWRKSLSYRNQFIDLQSKSIDWFLYDKYLRHERVKRASVLTFQSRLHHIISITVSKSWSFESRGDEIKNLSGLIDEFFLTASLWDTKWFQWISVNIITSAKLPVALHFSDVFRG